MVDDGDDDLLDWSSIDPTSIIERLKNESSDYFVQQKISYVWKLLIQKRDYVNVSCQCQVILDKTWEHLNTGYWKDVKLVWRLIFSFASLMKTYSLYRSGQPEAALKACDMGLLMGAPIFQNILGTLASKLSTLKKRDEGVCVNLSTIDEQPVCKKTKPATDEGIESRMDSRFMIKRVESPSLIKFQELYLHAQKPVIITKCMDYWPAMGARRWNINYLQNVAGSRTVPVEIGDKYTSETWTQTLMTVNNFIEKYITDRTQMGYLAQHQLFEQIPELKKDIFVPDYCYLSETDDGDDSCGDTPPVLMNAWFGPKGTVSPLHHDPYQNLLAQVMGSKYIRLYEKESPFMYANVDSILDNTSQVDLEAIDLEEFPRFHENMYHECILNEGEMLFIPFKWWHFVKSLSTSFSVSFWWK